LDRPLQFHEALVDLPVGKKSAPEKLVGKQMIGRAGHGVPQEDHIIPPKTHLVERRRGQQQDDRRRDRGKNPCAKDSEWNQLGDQPADRKKDSN
jgi:hypothetical protein